MKRNVFFVLILLGYHYAAGQKIIFSQKDQICVLPAAMAMLSGGLASHPYQDLDKNPKIFAIENWRNSQQFFTWEVHISRQGNYKFAILMEIKRSLKVASAHEVTFVLSSSRGSVKLQRESEGWDKLFFASTLALDTGIQQLRLTAEFPDTSAEISLYSLELARSAVWEKEQLKAESLRSKPLWLNEAKYGLFIHWNARSQPRKGKAKSYKEAVNDFNVDAFAAMVKSTGADFIVFTTSWALQTFPGPLASLDSLLPGNTTQRDLIADVADALQVYGIRLIIYCNFRIDRLGWRKENMLSSAKSTGYFNSLISIYKEIGERYGGKIAGVWIDDGMTLYPYNAPFEKMTAVLKQKNKNIVVGYNSWIYPGFTDFQDFYGGELGITPNAATPKYLAIGGDGYFTAGPQKGLKATFCGLLEPGDWTHTKPDEDIPYPLLSVDSLAHIVQMAIDRKNLPIMNVQIYQDGIISPKTQSLLKQLNKKIREER